MRQPGFTIDRKLVLFLLLILTQVWTFTWYSARDGPIQKKAAGSLIHSLCKKVQLIDVNALLLSISPRLRKE